MAKVNPKYAEMVMKSVCKLYTDADRKALGMEPAPKTLILDASPWKLFRYSKPDVRHVDAPPVLIIPSLINRAYIMNLLPGHSLIDALADAGLDIFILDWGVPGEEHGHLGLAHYIGKFMKRAVRQVRKLTGAPKVQLLGQCIGGTMAALYAAHPVLGKDVARLALLTTPLDLASSGLLSDWTKKEVLDIDRMTSSFRALVPSDFVHLSFPLLNIKATLSKYRTLLEKFEIPDFTKVWQALDIWATDNLPFTLAAFRDLIKLVYQENAIMTGKFEIEGRKIGARDIDVETLSVAAKEDHVFTEAAARGILESKAAKKGLVKFVVKGAGHVTLVVAHPIRFEVYKEFADFLSRK
jgi:polyhydroxyalkanoate synthase subunit PhaC